MSARAAPARCRARPATAAAAPSRPSPTPTSCSAGSTPGISSAARCGSMSAAPRAGGRRIAEPLGYHGRGRASSARRRACSRIANLTMAVDHQEDFDRTGYDPRDFVLFCYGGGGPLHGVELARALKIPRVIVPPEPGNFSAVGMLLADPRLDTAQTFVGRLNPDNLAKVVTRLRRARDARARRRSAASSATARSRSSARPRCATRASIIRSRFRVAETDDAGKLRDAVRPGIQRRYGHANSAAEVELVGAAFARRPCT